MLPSKKGDELAIGRPKGLSCAFRSRKRLGCRGVQGANPELPAAGAASSNEREFAPIGRDTEEGGVCSKCCFHPWAKGETNSLCGGRWRAMQLKRRPRYDRNRDGNSRHPDKALVPYSSR